jgi:hypothetical protein
LPEMARFFSFWNEFDCQMFALAIERTQ